MKQRNSKIAICALCLLGLSPALGQGVQPKAAPQVPQKTSREDAAVYFSKLMNEAAQTPWAFYISEPYFIALMSSISQSQAQIENEPGLFLVLANQWNARSSFPKPSVTVQEELKNGAVVRVEASASKTAPLVLVEKDGSWRVNLVATLAVWNDLPPTATLGEIKKKLEGTADGQVFTSARVNSRKATCQSQMAQVALGIVMWEQDHDGKFPSAKTWVDSSYPYVKSEPLYSCPSLAPGQKYGYAFNSNLSTKNDSVVASIDKTVLLYETTDLKRNAFGTGQNTAYRHNNGANYIFADGHVKWFAKTDKQPSFLLNPK